MNRKYNAYVKLTNNSVVPEGKSLAMLPNMTRNALYYDDNSQHFFGTTWLGPDGTAQVLLVTPVKALIVDHDGEMAYEV